MAEQQVDAHGGTIFNGAADVPTRARCRESNSGLLGLRTAFRVWRGRNPHYRVKPGIELDYTIGVRSVDSLPMVLGESV